MELILGLGTLLAIVTAWAVHQWTKRHSAEALLENQEVKEKIAEKDAAIKANEILIQSEEEKQKALEEKMKEEQSKGNTNAEIVDFFNRYTNRKK